MSIVDSLREALDHITQAQAKTIEGYGGQVPPGVSEQFQMIRDRVAGQMGWVKELSDRAEEAKAKLEARLAAEADDQQEDQDQEIDFESYPWQFRDEHKPDRDTTRRLLASLRDHRD